MIAIPYRGLVQDCLIWHRALNLSTQARFKQHGFGDSGDMRYVLIQAMGICFHVRHFGEEAI
jgi:hypothetical protein